MSNNSLVWKPRNSPYYHMDFQVDGDRITGTTGLRNRKDAVAQARRTRTELISRRTLLGTVGPDMTLLAAADRYMREAGQFRSNAKTIERSIDWLVNQIGPYTPLREIDDRVLAEAVNKRRKMHRHGLAHLGTVKNSTVNEEIVNLTKRILIRARNVWKVHLPAEPLWKDHKLGTKQRIREMTVVEEFRIQAARPDLWPIIEFILLSGLRRKDAIIRWDQVDEDEGVIHCITKYGRPHDVPIIPEIQELLDAARGHDDEFVFTFVARGNQGPAGRLTHVKGRRYPITYGSLYTMFKRTCAEAGVEGLHVHDLRRTSGGRMHRVTGDIATVQEHLGHADVGTTRKQYVHIPSSVVRDRMRKAAKRYAVLRRRALQRELAVKLTRVPQVEMV